jgi:PIN domain nuclease of toxin-antitoxin system
MKLLLDTHVFVWTTIQTVRLSGRAKSLISDRANVVLVSAISAYELEFKRPRDALLSLMPTDLGEAVQAQDFEWLPLTPEHATVAGRLPRLHGDPFDRLLAAQALVEQAVVVTRDPLIAPYGAPVAW